MPTLFLSIMAFRNHKKWPFKYKNTNLAMPALIYGFLCLAAYVFYLFYLLFEKIGLIIASLFFPLLIIATLVYISKGFNNKKKEKTITLNSRGEKRANIYAVVSFMVFAFALLFLIFQYFFDYYLDVLPYSLGLEGSLLIFTLLLFISLILSITAYERNKKNPAIFKYNKLFYPGLFIGPFIILLILIYFRLYPR